MVYYLRLDPLHRDKFQQSLHGMAQEASVSARLKLQRVLNDVMDALLENTELEPGIARTQGLKENVFMVAMCQFARIPLMIIGPPGSSKTLSVTVVTANAKGAESKSKDSFYRTQKRLVPFHYQCSNRSTSREIDAVFRRAIDRQKSAYGDMTAMVFMDGALLARSVCNFTKRFPLTHAPCSVLFAEAGLPEEGRESLKVLHYYLEEHVSQPAQVGFVAITNHVLDAAKSARYTRCPASAPRLPLATVQGAVAHTTAPVSQATAARHYFALSQSRRSSSRWPAAASATRRSSDDCARRRSSV